jgi:tripartite-type tricarboxylate transporter receptor subunit TctC
LRALAVANKTRVAVLPDVPTLAEAGLPGFESSTWYGLLAPAGTPAPIVERLNREIVGYIKGDLGRRLEAQGVIPRSSTPQEFAALIDADIKKWGAIVARTGTKLD